MKSQEWRGSDYMRYDEDMCYQENPPDICNQDGFDINSLDPTLQSVTGLYSRDLYCSECFLKVWRQKLTSPFLINGTWTDYRIEQFAKLQSQCSTSMPYTTSAATLYVGTPTAPTVTTAIGGPSTTSVTITPTCAGQVVQQQSEPLTCNGMSDQYNVSTGDVRYGTNNYDCGFEKTACFPLPCQLKVLDKYGLTCAQLATSLSNSTHKVTVEQFLGWNQNIQGSCDSLSINQRVCVR